MRPSTGVLFRLTCCLLAGAAGLASTALAGGAGLRIGVPQSFFQDVSDPLVETATEPFVQVMKQTTGLAGDLAVGGDTATVVRQLRDNKFQLGVFHGSDFARLREQDPDLRPLMIAYDAPKDARVHVVVRADSPATQFADLKGKTLAMPKRTRQPSRLFLDRLVAQAGADSPKAFFGTVARPANVETALDDLVRGKTQAALIDSGGLAFYKGLRPGPFGRLKVLAASGPTPPAVLAYRQGAVPDATLTRLRQGLPTADKTEAGQELMQRWKVRGFEPAPADFDQQLAATLKAFPGEAK